MHGNTNDYFILLSKAHCLDRYRGMLTKEAEQQNFINLLTEEQQTCLYALTQGRTNDVDPITLFWLVNFYLNTYKSTLK